MIDRYVLLNPNLSLEAKGLYAYLEAGGEAIRMDTPTPAMQELLNYGYLIEGYET